MKHTEECCLSVFFVHLSQANSQVSLLQGDVCKVVDPIFPFIWDESFNIPVTYSLELCCTKTSSDKCLGLIVLHVKNMLTAYCAIM